MIKLFGDPIEIVIEATRRVFGEMNCEIRFTDKLYEGDKGSVRGVAALRKDVESDYIVPVFLSIHNKIAEIPETLAHELAHVVVGPDVAEHGKEWREAMEKIAIAYNEVFEEKYPDFRKSEEILDGCGYENGNDEEIDIIKEIMSSLADEGVSAEEYSEFLNNLKCEAQNDR